MKIFIEGIRNIDGVLARCGVHEKQNLIGMDLVIDVLKFFHEAFIDLQAARGIENQDIDSAFPSLLLSGFSDFHGVFGSHGEEFDAKLVSKLMKLVNGGWTIDVKCPKHDFFVLLVLEKIRELARGRCLTGSLQADKHDGRES